MHEALTGTTDEGGGYKFNRFQFGNAAICWAFPQIRVSRCPGNGNINIEVRWGLKGTCSDMKVFERNMFNFKFDPISSVFVKLHSLCTLPQSLQYRVLWALNTFQVIIAQTHVRGLWNWPEKRVDVIIIVEWTIGISDRLLSTLCCRSPCNKSSIWRISIDCVTRHWFGITHPEMDRERVVHGGGGGGLGLIGVLSAFVEWVRE